MTLFFALTLELQRVGTLTKPRLIILVISGMLACLLRNNMIYAMLVWVALLMLFGKGVAASRNQYNVYVMELDQDMREISVDVRRFCYKKDYSFSVCPMPDGSVSLFSNGSGDEQQEGVPVMVPFEALQQTDRNGIELR